MSGLNVDRELHTHAVEYLRSYAVFLCFFFHCKDGTFQMQFRMNANERSGEICIEIVLDPDKELRTFYS